MSAPDDIRAALRAPSQAAEPLERLGPRTWATPTRVATRSRSPRTHAQLLALHHKVGPALRGAGLPLPRLLAHTDTVVVTERAPGQPLAVGLQPFDPPPAGALAALGRWLRVLHRLPDVPADPLPLDQAVARRIERTLQALPAELAHDLAPHLHAPLLRDAARTWAHRDLHPRNALWDGQALVLIDWEHARPDHPAVDFARVPAPLLHGLARGYGPLPDPPVLRLFRVLDAATTLAWGLRHHAPDFVQDGRSRLRRALSRSG